MNDLWEDVVTSATDLVSILKKGSGPVCDTILTLLSSPFAFIFNFLSPLGLYSKVSFPYIK